MSKTMELPSPSPTSPDSPATTTEYSEQGFFGVECWACGEELEEFPPCVCECGMPQ
ncbi:hypothetical protein K402DRAFT_393826 [Aulographum hederae CBS 113979]|uniref:Uncharacterized protein n=1 Tax=Aulographum hederae CBS 113979 TaxID=1176131 RepID=A0A6G1GZX6_9PEZI|nr:hypothetical protein K402DRAFT_393826 [Aulographum hederae CBS 113979]